ncbi:hypothetical protein KQX54_007966 [Cotesia glomerata]|uniref:Uncharacterized protein n=1 Tax=Cotesia glomerata TaxID=32391 RepID=A0AAV7J690_COTGL|nr:hypothetical protein KQX54_007966 [Cotesia glomerata]
MRKRLGHSAGGRGHKRVLAKGGGWLVLTRGARRWLRDVRKRAETMNDRRARKRMRRSRSRFVPAALISSLFTLVGYWLVRDNRKGDREITHDFAERGRLLGGPTRVRGYESHILRGPGPGPAPSSSSTSCRPAD